MEQQITRRELLVAAMVSGGAFGLAGNARAFNPDELLAVKHVSSKISLSMFKAQHKFPVVRACMFLTELGMPADMIDDMLNIQRRFRKFAFAGDAYGDVVPTAAFDVHKTIEGCKFFTQLCEEKGYTFHVEYPDKSILGAADVRGHREVWFSCMMNFKDNSDALGLLNGEYF